MRKFKLSHFLNGRSVFSTGADAMKSQGNGAAEATSKGASVTASPPRMSELARKIASEAEKVEAYFEDNDIPLPSFEVDSPADYPRLPDEIQKSRQEVIAATKKLRELAVGPRESVRWSTWGVCLFLFLFTRWVFFSSYL